VKNRYQDMFRPLYEVRSGSVWAASAVAVASMNTLPLWGVFAAFCSGMSFIRFRKALSVLSFRMAISAQRLKFLTYDQMEVIGKDSIENHKAFYLGEGFAWGKTEAQLAWEISKRDSEDICFIPKRLPKKIREWITPSNTVPDDEAMGCPWIHGLGAHKEETIRLRLDTLPGHVGISGTTRSGKTRLYAVLVSQMTQMKDACLIIIDPKGDKDLEALARNFAKRNNRDYLYFHPQFPSQSIRLNPIKNWNVIADIGARIGTLISSDGSDNFTKFCELSVNRICYGLEMVGVRPSLKEIRRYAEMGIEHLLEDCFGVLFTPLYGTDWDQKIGQIMSKDMKVSRIEAMARFYSEQHSRQHGNNDVIDGLITTLYHSKEHYGKMILALLPLMQTLCMGELGKMLSPDTDDIEDPRPIYDMESIILGKKVFYMSLDSLTNQTVAHTLASTTLAEIATVAGTIYNHHPKQTTFLLFDEVFEVASPQLVQILNKGGGGGFQAFLAMQANADLEAKLKSPAAARQFFANMNTQISLRVLDETAEWVSGMMGETAIDSFSTSYSTGTETEAHIAEYRGSISRSNKEERVPLVHKDYISSLPNLQYFARLDGGKRIIKGMLPIVLEKVE